MRCDNFARIFKKCVLIHFGEQWTQFAIKRGRFGVVKGNWCNGLRQRLSRYFPPKALKRKRVVGTGLAPFRFPITVPRIQGYNG